MCDGTRRHPLQKARWLTRLDVSRLCLRVRACAHKTAATYRQKYVRDNLRAYRVRLLATRVKTGDIAGSSRGWRAVR